MTDARAWHRTTVIKPLACLFTDSATCTDFGRTDNNTYMWVCISPPPPVNVVLTRCIQNIFFIRRMHSRRLNHFFIFFVHVLYVYKSVVKGSGDDILLPELLGIRTFPVITYSNRNTASRKLNLVPFYFRKSCDIFFNTRLWNNFRRQISLNVLSV
jgi:hypothetical protein